MQAIHQLEISEQTAAACAQAFPCMHRVSIITARPPDPKHPNAPPELLRSDERLLDGRYIWNLLQMCKYPDPKHVTHFKIYECVNPTTYGAKKEYKTTKHKNKQQSKDQDVKHQVEQYDKVRNTKHARQHTRHTTVPKLNTGNRRRRRMTRKGRTGPRSKADDAETAQFLLNAEIERSLGVVPVMQMQNVVSKGVLRGGSNVTLLHEQLYSKLQDFPPGVVTVHKPACTVTIYESGQLSVAGGVTMMEELLAVHLVVHRHIIQEQKYIDVVDFSCVNMIGTFHCGKELDLKQRYNHYKKNGYVVTYDAENFTGLHLHIPDQRAKIKVLMHNTGWMNIVGMKNIVHFEECQQFLVPRLCDDTAT